MAYQEQAGTGTKVFGYTQLPHTWQIEGFVDEVSKLAHPAGTSIHFLEYNIISSVHKSRDTWHHWFDNGHALACDVNLKGTNDQTEFAWLRDSVYPLAKKWGLSVTCPVETNGYGVAGHSIGDGLHLHADCGRWSNLGHGAVKAPFTKALSSRPSTGGGDYHKGDNVVQGDTGNAVKYVQRVIGVKTDGVFGPNTEAALKRWQRAHGLADDGIWGDKSKAKASQLLSRVHGPFRLPAGQFYGVDDKTNRSHSGVREADQTYIKQIQHSVGAKADGIFGNGTRDDVMKFQRTHWLAVDGKVGPRTWVAMANANK